MKYKLLIVLFSFLCALSETKNLLDEIKSRRNLSQMASIILNDRLLPAMMMNKGFTAFIPTDSAMDKYEGPRNRQFVYYHLTNVPYEVQNLPSEITTELTGNPRLYVTRIPTGRPAITGWEDNDVFVNNAKIISANHKCQADEGAIQYLNVIDEVLAPTVPVSPDPTNAGIYDYPNAQDVLMRPREYGFRGETSLSEFRKRVLNLNLMGVFNISGSNTFFFPVDQSLTSLTKTPNQDLLDKPVIHGHVVPDHVLFERTVHNKSLQFKSLAFADSLKVLISMENFTDVDKNDLTYYVTSNTIASDASHKKGAAFAKIIKGNIPVKNGVIHLIDRPLMTVASSIISYFQEEGGLLSEFHKLISEFEPSLSNLLTVGQGLTVFAPSNQAFTLVNRKKLEQVKMNNEEMQRLLHLHIVDGSLTTDEIVEKSSREIFQVETKSLNRKLYFAVNDVDAPVPTVSLEGAGVNATITIPNIVTKNGVIHVIDHVLGIPSQTVDEKLHSDPMLSSTYHLSLQEGWNKRLSNRNEKFTLFVPNNDAWEYIRREMPSAHKKLFMGAFPYQVRYILERHMIAGQELSLEDLVVLTSNRTVKDDLQQQRLQMMRGKIYFQARVRENFGDYYVEWNGISARVTRPDVQCVNGVVHVIDKVLMQRRDVTVNHSESLMAGGPLALLSSALAALLLQ